jgi:hypothetical protein
MVMKCCICSAVTCATKDSYTRLSDSLHKSFCRTSEETYAPGGNSHDARSDSAA